MPFNDPAFLVVGREASFDETQWLVGGIPTVRPSNIAANGWLPA